MFGGGGMTGIPGSSLPGLGARADERDEGRGWECRVGESDEDGEVMR